jgi:uncharacterized protein YggU (UPF0235/DUF167 family)
MGIIVQIKAVPSSGRTGFVRDKGGTLKCFLKSPAERGLANDELIAQIAQALQVPKNKIMLGSGATSRSKRLLIDAPYSEQEIWHKLGVAEPETQLSFIGQKKN